MPNPKRKHSKSRSRKRRSHHHLRLESSSLCPHCGAAQRPHRACPECGQYRGREVIEVENE